MSGRTPSSKKPGQILPVDDAVSLHVLAVESARAHRETPFAQDQCEVLSIGGPIAIDVGILGDRVRIVRGIIGIDDRTQLPGVIGDLDGAR